MTSPAAVARSLAHFLDVARTRGVTGLVRAVRRRLGARLRAHRRPPTLRSRAAPERLRRKDPRPPLHVLHIGKTGGTALKHTFLEHLDDSRRRLLLHGHDVTLEHVPRSEHFMFTLRDPVSRFVSAFNGRLREDRPRYHYPWRDDERVAFAVFKTPDQLASALSSTDDAERACAERAMHGIGHVNTPYATWFGDMSSFRRRLSDVYFIAYQEQLDDDFELLKERLGLPPHVCLPSDPVAAPRSTALREGELGDSPARTSGAGMRADVAFVDYCRELAPLVNPAEVPRRRGSVGPSVPQRTTAPAAAPLAERRLGPLGWGARVAITALAGVAAFAAAAGLVETFSDRDWSLSGFEWPADFATAMGIMALVPLVLNALSASARTRRRGSTDSRVRDRVA